MLPRDEPAAPDMTPRNRGERRAAARATVKRHLPHRGRLDVFRVLAVADYTTKQPLRAQPPAPLPAGHISRQVRRAHARAMRAAIDAATVARSGGRSGMTARGTVTINGQNITAGA